jgi:uncharacterized protein YodC (DUF2158 family)
MAQQPFQVGDIVRMRSGGPPMTVTRLGCVGDQVRCTWFESRGRPHYYYLDIGALEPTDPDSAGQHRD